MTRPHQSYFSDFVPEFVIGFYAFFVGLTVEDWTIYCPRSRQHRLGPNRYDF